jgi:hypothetical protein
MSGHHGGGGQSSSSASSTRSNLQKLLQLRLYSFLSSRWGIVVVVLGAFLCLNTLLQIAHVAVSGHYGELRCMQYGTHGK